MGRPTARTFSALVPLPCALRLQRGEQPARVLFAAGESEREERVQVVEHVEAALRRLRPAIRERLPARADRRRPAVRCARAAGTRRPVRARPRSLSDAPGGRRRRARPGCRRARAGAAPGATSCGRRARCRPSSATWRSATRCRRGCGPASRTRAARRAPPRDRARSSAERVAADVLGAPVVAGLLEAEGVHAEQVAVTRQLVRSSTAAPARCGRAA